MIQKISHWKNQMKRKHVNSAFRAAHIYVWYIFRVRLVHRVRHETRKSTTNICWQRFFLFSNYELRRDAVRSGEWLKTAGAIRLYSTAERERCARREEGGRIERIKRFILRKRESIHWSVAKSHACLPDCLSRGRWETTETRGNHNRGEYRRMKMRWDKCTYVRHVDSVARFVLNQFVWQSQPK